LSQLKISDVDLSEQKLILKPRERRSLAAGKKIVYLSKNEVSSLLNAINQTDTPRAKRDLAIINLLLETGISIGVLVDLDLSDLNLRSGKVQVKMGAGLHTSLAIPETVELMQSYLKVGRPELTQSSAETALFVSQMGGRISRQGVWQLLRNWGKQAKLKQILSPRVVRHTAACNMLASGKRIEEIQRYLGHRNLISTRSLVRRLKRVL
jgi:integrase/recombinase XerD